MIHKLKCWPVYFRAIEEKRKTFDARKNDRDFKVGDMLELVEFDPTASEYSGDIIRAEVTYILHGGNFGIEKGWCVMAIKVFEYKEVEDE